MQIRELDYKELDTVYEVVLQLYPELSYDAFENLVYDMRHIQYKMFGILEREKLIAFAGVAVVTNLYYKRHLCVFDLVTDKEFEDKKYTQIMLEYLYDHAKISMAENIVLTSHNHALVSDAIYEKNGFTKSDSLFVKPIITLR